MHRILILLAYGWLVLGGTLHFFVDVVGRHLRGLHPPGPQTMLYDGLHTSFAFGQVLLGGLGLWLAFRARELLDAWPAIALSVVAGLVWLAIAILFIEFLPPRFNVAVYLALIVAAALTSTRG